MINANSIDVPAEPRLKQQKVLMYEEILKRFLLVKQLTYFYSQVESVSQILTTQQITRVNF